jgi:excisionase family DNA binding protein
MTMTTPRPGPGYLTVEQVAERLQLGPETIRRMLRDGRLNGVRLGGPKAGWRVSAESVAMLLLRGDQSSR